MNSLIASNLTVKYSLGEVPHEFGTIGLLALTAIETAGAAGAVEAGGTVLFSAGQVAVVGATGPSLAAAVSITAAQAIGAAIVIGATVAVSVLVSPKQGRKLDATDIVIKQSLPGRFIDIGRVKTAGCIFFEDQSQAFNDSLNAVTPTLVIGTILSCTPIQEVETIYFQDAPVINSAQMPADQQVVAPTGGYPWTGKLQVEKGRGQPTDTAPTILFRQFPVIYSTGSTPDPAYANRGLAYAVVSYSQDLTVQGQTNSYPQGAPPVAAVIKGAMLPDPRNAAHDLHNPATWTWSDNSALAVLRFCLDQDGWGLQPEDFDLASFAAAAHRCEDTTPDGPRYSSWGRYWTTAERAQNLRELLMACDGRLVEQADGTAALRVGAYPTNEELAQLVTIQTADIIEATFNPFGDTLDRVGSVKTRFVDEMNNWQEIDGPEVSLANPDVDQAIKTEDLPIQFCPRAGQAARLAKARLRSLNPDWRANITTRLIGMQVMGERFVRVVFQPPGGLNIDRIFEIVGGISLNLAGGVPTSVSMTLQSVNSDNWDI